MKTGQVIALVGLGAGVLYLISRQSNGLSAIGTPQTRTAGVVPAGAAGVPSLVTQAGTGITSVISSISSAISRAIAPKVTAPGNTNPRPAAPAGPPSPGDPATGYRAPATAPFGLVAPGAIQGVTPPPMDTWWLPADTIMPSVASIDWSAAYVGGGPTYGSGFDAAPDISNYQF